MAHAQVLLPTAEHKRASRGVILIAGVRGLSRETLPKFQADLAGGLDKPAMWIINDDMTLEVRSP